MTSGMKVQQIKIFSGLDRLAVEGEVNRFLIKCAQATFGLHQIIPSVTQSGNMVIFTILVQYEALVNRDN